MNFKTLFSAIAPDSGPARNSGIEAVSTVWISRVVVGPSFESNSTNCATNTDVTASDDCDTN